MGDNELQIVVPRRVTIRVALNHASRLDDYCDPTCSYKSDDRCTLFQRKLDEDKGVKFPGNHRVYWRKYACRSATTLCPEDCSHRRVNLDGDFRCTLHDCWLSRVSNLGDKLHDAVPLERCEACLKAQVEL